MDVRESRREEDCADFPASWLLFRSSNLDLNAYMQRILKSICLKYRVNRIWKHIFVNMDVVGLKKKQLKKKTKKHGFL